MNRTERAEEPFIEDIIYRETHQLSKYPLIPSFVKLELPEIPDTIILGEE